MRRTIAYLLPMLVACTTQTGRESAPVRAGSEQPAPGAGASTHEASERVLAREPGAELVFTPREGWVVETPSSAMRKAQYRLPAAEGDADDASLVVYFFPNAGGTLEANLERWAGQFEQEDGSVSIEALRRSRRMIAGMPVTEADLAGTYVAETSPGSGQRVNKPRWRMRAAIVESDHGPYYVKLVGPAATVGRWEASYMQFLGAIR